jgi:hypothetical protein
MNGEARNWSERTKDAIESLLLVAISDLAGLRSRELASGGDREVEERILRHSYRIADTSSGPSAPKEGAAKSEGDPRVLRQASSAGASLPKNNCSKINGAATPQGRSCTSPLLRGRSKGIREGERFPSLPLAGEIPDSTRLCENAC